MNILIITQLYPEPDDEGDNRPTKTVEYFAKEWVEMGHRVVVIHCPSKFPLVFYIAPKRLQNRVGGQSSNIVPPMSSRKPMSREAYGIQVYRYPMLKLLPGMGYSTARMKNQAGKIIDQLDAVEFIPELVVGHFANPSTALTCILAKHYQVKSSIVFHHDCNERNLTKYSLGKWSAEIGAIGARSIIEANSIKSLLGLKQPPFLCYSGVPNETVDAAATICNKHSDSNKLKILYVGSFIKRKHVDAAINAFAAIENDDSAFEIAGGGPEEDELKKLASSTSASDRIHFCGRISRNEVMEKMKQAEVFTLISEGETFGMVYIEAMLQGCIVIASKGGGFDGIIKDGLNGFICKPGDDKDLADIYRKIKKLSREERNNIGQNAVNLAIHFSEREVAENYLNDIIKNQGAYH